MSILGIYDLFATVSSSCLAPPAWLGWQRIAVAGRVLYNWPTAWTWRRLITCACVNASFNVIAHAARNRISHSPPCRWQTRLRRRMGDDCWLPCLITAASTSALDRRLLPPSCLGECCRRPQGSTSSWSVCAPVARVLIVTVTTGAVCSAVRTSCGPVFLCLNDAVSKSNLWLRRQEAVRHMVYRQTGHRDWWPSVLHRRRRQGAVFQGRSLINRFQLDVTIEWRLISAAADDTRHCCSLISTPSALESTTKNSLVPSILSVHRAVLLYSQPVAWRH